MCRQLYTLTTLALKQKPGGAAELFWTFR